MGFVSSLIKLLGLVLYVLVVELFGHFHIQMPLREEVVWKLCGKIWLKFEKKLG